LYFRNAAISNPEPLSNEPVKLKAEEPELAKGTDIRRVLLIEDIQDVAEVLRSLLAEEGHEVMVANDGMRGVEMAREILPDVVFCDIGLPGMDGYKVARVLRADETLKNTFLVSLTGYARPEDIKRSKEAGFDLQLSKPIDLDDLRKVIGQL
jgi:two-component system, chemotaxis family, CheB/CheR fusion protein